MNFQHNTCYEEANFSLRNHLPHIGKDLVTRNILSGLTCQRKHISSMFFYDATGSKLFEEITRLPEYYPTRTEKRLLHEFAPRLLGGRGHQNIVEIGSGDGSKISILLGTIPPQQWTNIRYCPLDVSQDAIEGSAEELQRQFPGIEICGIVADFTRQLHIVPDGGKRLICFLGSTLGNLSREQAKQFFLDLNEVMFPGDELLLGVDMIKPVHVLERAYNDGRGVTAEFNRNILHVVNRLIGTDFDPVMFHHRAFYNESENRIEMHLEASRDMEITCPAIPDKISIRRGETIHTENSHKYTRACILGFAMTAGLTIKEIVTDENRWFSLIHFLKE